MRRREAFALLASVAITWPFLAHSQQKAMPVVGFLTFNNPPTDPRNLTRGPVHDGMGELGFIEGQNMIWTYRFAEHHNDWLPELAADLVRRKVDLIITGGGAPAALAAKNATSTIPIVFVHVGDPVGFGLVASLARPGGNITGISNLTLDLERKQIELLCELVPRATSIALLVNPSNPVFDKHIRTTQEGADEKGIKLVVLKATTEAEIDAAFEQLQADALFIVADDFFGTRTDQLVALTIRYKIPSMSWHAGWVKTGGLISYGSDFDTVSRQGGVYAAKILQGAKPADLPVAQPTVFKLMINLNTAKALGVTVPQSLLARADEVIE
jgi:putative ABC transport system substrate-binding protein